MSSKTTGSLRKGRRCRSMSEQAEKDKNIWDVVFQPHRPVHIAFHDSMFESDYTFEGKDDHGVFVLVANKRKVEYIPWTSVYYLAWRLSEESEEKEKGEGDESV